MINLKLLEYKKILIEKKLKERGYTLSLAKLFSLIEKRRILINSIHKKQGELKKLSKIFILIKNKKKKKLKEFRLEINKGKFLLRNIDFKIKKSILKMPNIPNDNVPGGLNYKKSLIVKNIFKPRKFNFKIKNHIEISKKINIVDFKRGAKVSGARFSFLLNDGSKLNRSLLQFFCDYHLEYGDIELTPPALVLFNSIENTGQASKFKENLFKIRNRLNDLYLIPTSEVPVTNYFSNEILNKKIIPLRFFSYSPCFRAEAGAAGKSSEGLIRQHQFEKIEMVRFVKFYQMEKELFYMIKRVSNILVKLNLPHRIINTCVRDLGFSAEKTYDIEVWFPSKKKYVEVSSCSSFNRFQARRAKIKYRENRGERNKLENLITLNGSALPLGRIFAAILENFQQKDGSILLPRALFSYMGGVKRISIK
jgi:seryl-tRNA synthetase